MAATLRAGARELLGKFPLVDGYFRRLIWSRLYFPEAEMALLHSLRRHSADLAIDVGAAMGGYCWLLNRVSRRVIAFEPGDWHCAYLRQLLLGTRIELVCAAVGAEAGEVELITPGDDVHARHSATLHGGNPVARTSGAHVSRVHQVSIDGYLEQTGMAGRLLDILKVDVEGYEYQVLLGASAALQRHRPLLICEIEARHNADYRAVFDMMRALGYACYARRGGQYRPISADEILSVQSEADLAIRLSPRHRPADNGYVNNFVFQHPDSRVRVV
jgi:FkbM family methyltransferase